MLIVISPAKTLDYENPAPTRKWTEPDYLDQSGTLVKRMRDFSGPQLADLMKVSPRLADLNVARFQDWAPPFHEENAKQALFAFQGDVYQGLDASTLEGPDLTWAQKHLRILSGLYGLLRPLDLMQPYRLEMGTKVKVGEARNLYDFWGSDITEGLNKALGAARTQVLVNLASNEYFKSVRPKELDGEIVTPVFKECKDGELRVMALFAKRARGIMSRAIVQNRWTEKDQLRTFSEQRYRFDPDESTDTQLVFTRDYIKRKK